MLWWRTNGKKNSMKLRNVKELFDQVVQQLADTITPVAIHPTHPFSGGYHFALPGALRSAPTWQLGPSAQASQAHTEMPRV